MSGVSIAQALLGASPLGSWENPARLEGIRALANLAIFLASLSIARRLFGLGRGELSGRSAARLLVSLALLTIVSGSLRFGALLGVPRPAEPVPTFIKVVAGVLWVIVAFRLSDLALAKVDSQPRVPNDPGLPHDRLKQRIRSIERIVQSESWLLGKSEALRELRDILAELEAEQCKISSDYYPTGPAPSP